MKRPARLPPVVETPPWLIEDDTSLVVEHVTLCIDGFNWDYSSGASVSIFRRVDPFLFEVEFGGSIDSQEVIGSLLRSASLVGDANIKTSDGFTYDFKFTPSSGGKLLLVADEDGKYYYLRKTDTGWWY